MSKGTRKNERAETRLRLGGNDARSAAACAAGSIWWRRRSAICATSRLRALETLAARRRHRLRGHPRHPQAHRALRHRDAAHALSRAQRRRGAAETSGAARRRASRGAGIGCRHAADFRSRLQAGARGARGRPHRDRAARRVGGARSARRRRFADRPLFLRGLSAAEAGGAAKAHRRARSHSGDAGAVRKRAAHCRRARRSCRRASGTAQRRDLPRADQAARGDPPRRARRTRARLRGRRRDARRVRHRHRAAGGRRSHAPTMSTLCCAARSRASRSRTPSAKWRWRPGGRAARSISARWR